MPKCKTCRADILWSTTEAGRRVPLDTKPQRLFVIDGDKARLVDAYVSHFATCPQAEQHRRGAL